MPVTIGQYEYTLDTKNRLVVPSRYRDLLAEEKGSYFIVARGFDGCLFLLLPSQWEKFLQEMQERAKSIPDGAKARDFKRMVFTTATEAPLDDQGRILIQQNQKEYAGLKKDVVITGAGNKAEIWDAKRWVKTSQAAATAFQELAKDMDL